MIGFQENSRKTINTGYKKIRDFLSAMKSLQLSVVATTHHLRTNDLTTSKALSRAIK